jgi:hypothetical protein
MAKIRPLPQSSLKANAGVDGIGLNRNPYSLYRTLNPAEHNPSARPKTPSDQASQSASERLDWR